MKKLILSLLLLTFFHSLFARAETEAEYNDAVWKAMVEQFKKSVEKQVEQKIIEKAVEKMISDQAGEWVGPVFAIASLPGTINDYNNSETESGKFNALAGGVAAVWMSVWPATGIFAEMAVIGMQIQSAMIAKSYMLDNLKTMEEISRIYADVSEIEKQHAKADWESVTGIIAEMALAKTITEEFEKNEKERCHDINTPEVLRECIIIKQGIVHWAFFSEMKLKSLLEFSSSYFSVQQTFDILKWNLDETKKNLATVHNMNIKMAAAVDTAATRYMSWVFENVSKTEDESSQKLKLAVDCRENLAPVYRSLTADIISLATGKFAYNEDRDFLLSEFYQKKAVALRSEKIFCSQGLPSDLLATKTLLENYSSN